MPQKPLRERFLRQTPIPAPHGLKSLRSKLFKPCGAILSKIQLLSGFQRRVALLKPALVAGARCATGTGYKLSH